MDGECNSTDDVKVTVLFFAKSRELTEIPSLETHLPRCATREALISSIVSLFPSLAQLQNNIVLAVNQTYQDFGQAIELKQGDQIAIIPPLSGG